ncbi:MAG: chromate transporter [Acetobacteraceae bacterium]|nr:chromate transporter [Acetobacteraceae bacterium]
MSENLIRLCLLFGQLSLLAFGGANTILPDMQRQIVDVHHMMDAHTFAALFALAQAAPGPNLMVVSLIGWNVAGLSGAVFSILCIAGPSSVLTFLVARVWQRFRDAPWRKAVQNGLLPVTGGLLISSAALLIRSTTLDWSLGLLTAAATVLLLTTKVHPMPVLVGAAALGAVGVVG